MKTLFFDVKPWEKEYLVKKIKKLRLKIKPEFTEDHLTEDNLPSKKNAEIISVFVGSKVNEVILNAFPKLKFIITRSTGFDHVDVKVANKKGIPVSYVPGYGENTVAEFAFGLILTLSRKLYLCNDQIRETGSFSQEKLQGFDLKGKTLGVIGTGRIGKNVIKIAKAFDMNIIAYDPYPDKMFQKENKFEYLPFEKVLKLSDIITLHVPYMKETHHLINDKTIKFMKKGSYLINTARGQVIKTKALVKALQSGHLGGAGLDVLEEENITCDELEFVLNGHPEEHNLQTVLANHILIDMPNVIITPHNAFNTKEALERILDTTLENIQSFLDDKPKNLVKL